MQLVAYGAQDVYLTGNPQITFFKVVYRRHTNFSCEPIEQTFNGSAEFGRTVQCNISRNGDAITKMHLKAKLNATTGTAKWGYVSNLGNALIENVRVEIGGSKIDEHYTDWLNIWSELTLKTGQKRGYDRMIGNVSELTRMSTNHDEYTMYVPLQFWFNRNNGLALPLIALQYHDVKITMKFRASSECINWECTDGSLSAPATPELGDALLLIDYIYLDSEERKNFAQASHEYLIEQLQHTGSESASNQNEKYRLNYNHPSKYLIWAAKLDRVANRRKYLVAPTGDLEADKEAWVKAMFIRSRSNYIGVGDHVTNADINEGEVLDGSEDTNSGSDDLPRGSNVTGGLGRDVLNVIESVCQAVVVDPADNVTVNNVVVTDMSVVRDHWVNYLTCDLFDDDSNVQGACIVSHNNWSLGVNGTGNPVKSAKLQLNGHDRFSTREGDYFNYVQPYQGWSNTPADGINVYNFALKPEEHQPSGTCNFSRIDNTTLQVTFKQAAFRQLDVNGETKGTTSTAINDDSNVNVYTVNYNVLRIMSGMGGLAYSN